MASDPSPFKTKLLFSLLNWLYRLSLQLNRVAMSFKFFLKGIKLQQLLLVWSSIGGIMVALPKPLISTNVILVGYLGFIVLLEEYLPYPKIFFQHP
jgi:hypothetical protein